MHIEKHIRFLLATDLFKNFKEEELSDLFKEECYRISLYKKNKIIHFESEKCSTLDLIIQGEIIVQKIDEDGSILTIEKFRTGDNLGGNLLFSKDNSYPMTIISKEDTIMLQINGDLILELCQKNKAFLVEFLKCISDKTFLLTNKIKSISTKSLRESIIDFLNYEYYSQNSLSINLNMTKKELAERLGCERTSLSRELSKMKKNGLLTYDKNSITIKDLSIIKNRE